MVDIFINFLLSVSFFGSLELGNFVDKYRRKSYLETVTIVVSFIQTAAPKLVHLSNDRPFLFTSGNKILQALFTSQDSSQK